MLDVRPFLALRRLVRAFQPDVLHAWQPAGLRAAVLARGVWGTRVIASAVVPARPQGEVARQFDRWLARNSMTRNSARPRVQKGSSRAMLSICSRLLVTATMMPPSRGIFLPETTKVPAA